MADNSYALYCPPFLNHPRACPKNMNPYRPEVLSADQQTKTDSAKIKMAKHNEQYLGAHPEIKAIVNLILRSLFINRPVNIHEFVGDFVRREEFPDEIAEYLFEHLNFPVPEEEDDDVEIKVNESLSPEDDLVSETSSAYPVPVQAERRVPKKKLYAGDPNSLHSSQTVGRASVGLSYDLLIKMIRSSTSSGFEEAETESMFPGSRISEGEEEEEEAPEVSSVDSGEDNEEALLEGQRLIFAMLGRQISSSSFLEGMRTAKSNRHAVIVESEETENIPGFYASNARDSIFDATEASSADQVDDEVEEEEEEEYFEKE